MRIPCTAREIAAAVGGKLLRDGDTAGASAPIAGIS